MKINISGLSEGIYHYDLSKSADELGLGPNFVDAVLSDITLEKSIHQIVATVNASVKGVFICDRCANEFTELIHAKFTTVYTWDQPEETEEDDDFHILGKDDTLIDFSSSVKEYLLLSVPLKLLCKNNCVIPENIEVKQDTVDPRWQKLQTLIQPEKN